MTVVMDEQELIKVVTMQILISWENDIKYWSLTNENSSVCLLKLNLSARNPWIQINPFYGICNHGLLYLAMNELAEDSCPR